MSPSNLTTAAPTISIVVEWENIRLAEAWRAKEMLRNVGRQVSELSSTPDSAARITGPVELVVLYDEGALDGDAVASFIEDTSPHDHPDLALRLVPVTRGEYYELKNVGSRLATGKIIVFVDSDVIPEDGWLENLLEPFQAPGVRVVGGNSYIEPTGVWSKAFALFWFFPLRSDESGVHEHPGFFANNVAFRRETIERFPFPSVEGQTRGACVRLSATLRREGITIYRSESARVKHPAPNGVRHFVVRALAEGRDGLVRARESGGRQASLRGSLDRYRNKLRRGLRKILLNRQRVGLSRPELPVAVSLAVAYYTLAFAGELLAHARPAATGKRFRL